MMIKNVIYAGIILLTSILTGSYFYLVYQNNIDVDNPSLDEIDTSLEKSLDWVFSNRALLLRTNNPALWSFLHESAQLLDNRKLADLVNRYRYTSIEIDSPWGGYFGKTPALIYTPGSLDPMEDYQKFLVYGLTCNEDLAKEESIKKQMNIHFCDWKPYYSSCSTHLLMGIDLLANKNCGQEQVYKQLTSGLADIIEKQLTWEPRVGDVYIQRALMLIKTGYRDRVKSKWIRNILDEQRPDGGWANYYRLFNITDDTEFGFGYKFPEIRTRPSSSFHTTAQAIYLLSLEHAEMVSRQN